MTLESAASTAGVVRPSVRSRGIAGGSEPSTIVQTVLLASADTSTEVCPESEQPCPGPEQSTVAPAPNRLRTEAGPRPRVAPSSFTSPPRSRPRTTLLRPAPRPSGHTLKSEGGTENRPTNSKDSESKGEKFTYYQQYSEFSLVHTFRGYVHHGKLTLGVVPGSGSCLGRSRKERGHLSNLSSAET